MEEIEFHTFTEEEFVDFIHDTDVGWDLVGVNVRYATENSDRNKVKDYVVAEVPKELQTDDYEDVISILTKEAPI